MKDLDKFTVGPVHLQLFLPSVIRGPCTISQIKISYQLCKHEIVGLDSVFIKKVTFLDINLVQIV